MPILFPQPCYCRPFFQQLGVDVSVSSVAPHPSYYKPLIASKDFTQEQMETLIHVHGKGILDLRFDRGYQSALCYAVSHFDDLSLVKKLLDFGANVDEASFRNSNENALHAFMWRGGKIPLNLDTLKLLLARTQDIHATESNEFTLLHIFTATLNVNSNWDAVILLLEKGLDPDTETSDEETAYDLLIKKGAKLPSPLVEEWSERFLDLVDRYARTPPREFSLDAIQGKLKAIVEDFKDRSAYAEKTRNPPNLHLCLSKYARARNKDRGVRILQTHASLYDAFTRNLSHCYYLWRRSQHPDFASLFDPESFAYLQQQLEENGREIKILRAKKKIVSSDIP